MQSTRSGRLSRAMLCAAALCGLGGRPAGASLLVDVRAFTRNGVPVSDPKNVVVAVGDTVVFRVFAGVTGLNDSKPDCLQALSGSFLSTGGIKGTLALNAAGLTAPFNAFDSTGGHQSDLDADGDLDLGSNTDGNAEGFFAVRSDVYLVGPRSTFADGTSFFPPGAQPTAIPHGTEYRIVSTLRMFITSLGDPTIVNFRRRLGITACYWSEDATEITTDNGDGTTAYSYTGGTSFLNETNVTASGVTLSVPEPAVLGLSALACASLMTRRRARGACN